MHAPSCKTRPRADRKMLANESGRKGAYDASGDVHHEDWGFSVIQGEGVCGVEMTWQCRRKKGSSKKEGKDIIALLLYSFRCGVTQQNDVYISGFYYYIP